MNKTILIGISAAAFGLFCGGSAFAADLGPAPAPVYDWTGFYMGVNAGAAWNNSKVSSDVDSSGALGEFRDELKDEIQGDQTQFTGGGEIGYNWQIDSVVLGIEADLNYLNFDQSNKRSLGILGNLGETETKLDIQENYYGTLRARLGYAFDNVMIYGTGGLAYGHMEADGKITTDVGTWHGNESNTNWGWTIGGGMEYAFDENWIVGAEYMFVDLGDADFDFDGPDGDSSHVGSNVDVQFSVARATLKFKF